MPTASEPPNAWFVPVAAVPPRSSVATVASVAVIVSSVPLVSCTKLGMVTLTLRPLAPVSADLDAMVAAVQVSPAPQVAAPAASTTTFAAAIPPTIEVRRLGDRQLLQHLGLGDGGGRGLRGGCAHGAQAQRKQRGGGERERVEFSGRVGPVPTLKQAAMSAASLGSDMRQSLVGTLTRLVSAASTARSRCVALMVVDATCDVQPSPNKDPKLSSLPGRGPAGRSIVSWVIVADAPFGARNVTDAGRTTRTALPGSPRTVTLPTVNSLPRPDKPPHTGWRRRRTTGTTRRG